MASSSSTIIAAQTNDRHYARLRQLGILDDCYVTSCDYEDDEENKEEKESRKRVVSLCRVDCYDNRLRRALYDAWKKDTEHAPAPLALISFLFNDDSISIQQFRKLVQAAKKRYVKDDERMLFEKPLETLSNRRRLFILLNEPETYDARDRFELLLDVWNLISEKEFQSALAHLSPKSGADLLYEILSAEPLKAEQLSNAFIDAFEGKQKEPLQRALQTTSARLALLARQTAKSSKRRNPQASNDYEEAVKTIDSIVAQRLAIAVHKYVGGASQVLGGENAESVRAAALLDLLIDRVENIYEQNFRNETSFRGSMTNENAMLVSLVAIYRGKVCLANSTDNRSVFEWKIDENGYPQLSMPPSMHETLERCLVDSPARFVVGVVSLNDPKMAHANGFIIDKRDKSVELFEPHGSQIMQSLGDQLKIADFYAAFADYFRSNFPRDIKSIFTPADAWCPLASFQTLQEQEIDQSSITDPRGFCVAWTLWWIDFRLRNADSTLSRSELMRAALARMRALSSSNGLSMTDYIRNYANRIVEERDIILRDRLADTFEAEEVDRILQLSREREMLLNTIERGNAESAALCTASNTTDAPFSNDVDRQFFCVNLAAHLSIARNKLNDVETILTDIFRKNRVRSAETGLDYARRREKIFSALGVPYRRDERHQEYQTVVDSATDEVQRAKNISTQYSMNAFENGMFSTIQNEIKDFTETQWN